MSLIDKRDLKQSSVVFPGQVLSAMGRLSPYGDVRQRLFETLYFVKVVVLGSPSDIKEACMRVRLLHAAVRYHLCHREGGWEIEKVSSIILNKVFFFIFCLHDLMLFEYFKHIIFKRLPCQK